MIDSDTGRDVLWHPWAGFFEGKDKMAARYFKVKYDFLTNEARNKCSRAYLIFM